MLHEAQSQSQQAKQAYVRHRLFSHSGGEPVTRTGQCLCGNVMLALHSQLSRLDVCHCQNCQRQTGSPFAAFLAVPLSALQVEGKLKQFNDTQTVSGNTVERYFCSECGSPCYVRVARAPNTAYVFSGLFDHTDDLSPKGHGWTSQKHRWIAIDEAELQFSLDPELYPE